MARQPDDVRVACFDVFDTVLTRATGSPHSVFLLLGQRLARQSQIRCTPEVFYRLRIYAESTARRSRPSGEVSLADIYRELAASLSLTPEQARDLSAMEMEVERNVVRPVPRSTALIRKMRSQNVPVAFVSDMYHSSGFLELLLREAGVFQSGDRVFVSCEHAVSKHSGGLFRVVANAYGLAPQALDHYGNDEISDVVMPRSAGVRAKRCDDCDLTSYEAIAERHSLMTLGATSALAGASRLARLRLKTRGNYDAGLHDAATGVTAPFLVAYVSWVLRQAQQAGIRSLYFVSRDGQIMLQVAKRLAPFIYPDCSLRYLYGSRQAWHLPSMTEITPADFDWVFERRVRLTPEMILKRLHLSTEEASPILQRAGIPAARFNAELTDHDRQRIEQLLAPDEPLADLTLAKARVQRDKLKRYLEQEGVTSLQNWGMVEIGWRGRLQRSLERVLKDAAASAPTGYYVGLFRNADEPVRPNMQAYLFDRVGQTGRGHAPEAVAYISETFCQATHGMVTGYECVDNRIEPITDEAPTPARLQWGVHAVHDAVIEFVDSLPPDIGQQLEHADVRPLINDLFDEFWHRPSANEAASWGSFPYEDDQAGSFRTTLASKHTFADACRFLLTGRMPGHELSWTAASAIISPPHVKIAFRIARKLRQCLRPLKRLANDVHSRFGSKQAPPRGKLHDSGSG